MSLASDVWTVRSAVRADRAQLADIYLTVRRATFTWVDPGQFRREDFQAQSRGERLFVCEDRHGEIAGFLALWPPQNFIHMLYVRADFQGQGAGSALLEALPEWPSRRYRLKCLVHNRLALAFYLKHGFEVVGSGWSPEGSYNDMELKARFGRHFAGK